MKRYRRDSLYTASDVMPESSKPQLEHKVFSYLYYANYRWHNKDTTV